MITTFAPNALKMRRAPQPIRAFHVTSRTAQAAGCAKALPSTCAVRPVCSLTMAASALVAALITDRQSVPSGQPPAFEHLAPVLRLHSGAEAVLATARTPLRLPCSLGHIRTLVACGSDPRWPTTIKTPTMLVSGARKHVLSAQLRALYPRDHIPSNTRRSQQERGCSSPAHERRLLAPSATTPGVRIRSSTGTSGSHGLLSAAYKRGCVAARAIRYNADDSAAHGRGTAGFS
jgi:hypothetical protein